MNNTYKKITLVFGLFIMLSSSVLAQDTQTTAPPRNDSLIIERSSPDTVMLQSYASRYNPRKALLYAAILPGLGQIYNKKYWKLPLVYGGFTWIGIWVNNYNKSYKEARSELFYRLENGYEKDGDVRPGNNYTTLSYRNAVDRLRRERDFMIILMGGMYLLQIIDAHVDAHLKEFDLNPNLQVKLQPMIEQDAVLGRQTGISLTIKF
jgi:hypothetical protein